MTKYRILVLAALIASLPVLMSSIQAYAKGPGTKPVVAVDIGHSSAKPGAISATGVGEFIFNETIGRKLLQRLRERGSVEAFAVNCGSLKQRANAANRRKADLFISIHHDSVQPVYLSSWSFNGRQYSFCDRYEGFSIFFSGKNARPQDSLAFAEILGESMLKAGFRPSLHHSEPISGENRKLVDRYRGIYQVDDFQVLKQTKMPAVIVECGIIVNRQEEKRLRDPAYQERIVASLVQAIDDFFSNLHF
jgi:N-acetylmuramoyl-L-alanine amidase